MGSLLRTFLGILSLTALVTDISQNSVPYNTRYGHFSEFCPLQHPLRTFLRILSLTALVTDISQNSVPYNTRYGHFSEFYPLQHPLRTFLGILSLTTFKHHHLIRQKTPLAPASGVFLYLFCFTFITYPNNPIPHNKNNGSHTNACPKVVK